MNKMKFIFHSVLWKLCAILLTAILVMSSCKSNDVDDNQISYDPKKPIELNTFYPDSGKYLEKILLTGSNFGTDPEQIRVYFNSKKAAVIGSTGKRMYVLAPRLPGDTCIISVAIGNDSITYERSFIYHTSVTVTTIAGNGNRNNYQDGNLTESEVQPRYICVDKEDNIFFMNWVPDRFHVCRIDEEANELITIQRDMQCNVPAADPVTGIISFPTEVSVGSFVTLDPKEMWAPRIREMRWDPEGHIPQHGWKHAMVVNPTDGLLYCRYYFGDIISINPRTFEVTPIYMTVIGDNNGLTFIPQRPNILYMSFRDNAGVNAHSICSIDVTNPETTFRKLSGPGGGHRDGPLETALFRNPQQIFSDNDGNIYVADYGNHCIRRITLDGMVETVLGMPGTAGWKDGGKEEALFNGPSGVGISDDGTVYIADFDNNRIRKLSIN